jgi:putative transposase
MKLTSKPPRLHQDNGTYFLTFCSFERQSILLMPGVPEFITASLHTYAPRLDKLIAYTIMPDHMHLLVHIRNAIDLSRFLRDFKKWTSFKMREYCSPDTTHIWQRGTMDHLIRPSPWDHDFDNHLRYLYSNSWKHLHIPPRDFPYHNFFDSVREGLIDVDFHDFQDTDLSARYEP